MNERFIPSDLVDLDRYPVTDLAAPPRYVGLLAYDTKPGTESSDLLKMIRYGRTQPIESGA